MTEPYETAFPWRRTRREIETDPDAPNAYGGRCEPQLPTIEKRQWRIGTAMWFIALLIGLTVGAFHGPIALALSALTVVVPGVFVRFRLGWSHYEIGVAIGLAVTLGIVVLFALAMFLMMLLLAAGTHV